MTSTIHALIRTMSNRKSRNQVQSTINTGPADGTVHAAILKQARKSGQLNLSNRQLSEVPPQVWRINMDVPEEGRTISMDGAGDRWWEQVDLGKLILASNILASISPDIRNLPALTVLDLHDNRLSDLPDVVGELIHLIKLNLSHNQFVLVPSCVGCLRDLQALELQHNKLQQLPSNLFDNLLYLESLDLSHNELRILPPSVGFLSRVITLNLSQNQLQVLPHDVGRLMSLRMLDCTHNHIHTLPDEIGQLPKLEQLYLRHNRLTYLPLLTQCTVMKELYLGNNAIQGLTREHLLTLQTVQVLELRDNRLVQIPEDIQELQKLERLDLSNNNISRLPYCLGTLVSLQSIVLDGNPLKSIRRDIIMRGTNEVKKFLRSRMDSDPDCQHLIQPGGSILKPASGISGVIGSSNAFIDPCQVKSSKAFDYSDKKASSLPGEVWSVLEQSDVTVVNLSKNQLTELPARLVCVARTVTELNLGFNRLSGTLDPCIGGFDRLLYLDLRNNLLSDVPQDLKNLSKLRELVLSCNRFVTLPSVIYQLPSLEILLFNDNQLTAIDYRGLQQLNQLATLDLRNNNIGSVPPELGLCTQLRSLQLEGNSFRQPRPALLSSGTNALLEYLRGRITA